MVIQARFNFKWAALRVKREGYAMRTIIRTVMIMNEVGNWLSRALVSQWQTIHLGTAVTSGRSLVLPNFGSNKWEFGVSKRWPASPCLRFNCCQICRHLQGLGQVGMSFCYCVMECILCWLKAGENASSKWQISPCEFCNIDRKSNSDKKNMDWIPSRSIKNEHGRVQLIMQYN